MLLFEMFPLVLTTIEITENADDAELSISHNSKVGYATGNVTESEPDDSDKEFSNRELNFFEKRISIIGRRKKKLRKTKIHAKICCLRILRISFKNLRK